MGVGGQDLGGCGNEVENVAHYLISLSIYLPTLAAMRILSSDHLGARLVILDGLKWLFKRQKKDMLLFYSTTRDSMHTATIRVARKEVMETK